MFLLGGDSHKKKKKHSEDYYYRGKRGRNSALSIKNIELFA